MKLSKNFQDGYGAVILVDKRVVRFQLFTL
jgi:hypothetical protein